MIELGYTTVQIPLAQPTAEAIARLKTLEVELVFNLFEGFPGYPETEPIVPTVLSEMGIAYTGCSAKALALALNKGKAQAVLNAAGVSTPQYQILNPEMVNKFHLRYPVIVKPCSEDASHGLTEDSVVNDIESLRRQVNLMASLYGDEVIVEEFIDGREFNVTVLGNSGYEVLPITEITFTLLPDKPKLLTFAAKWEPESYYYKNTPPVCPAKLTDEVKKRIIEAAVISFRQLTCSGYARVDMRLDKDGCPNVIEVNPNPSISPTSGAASQVKAAGLTYTHFVEKIVRIAIEKGTNDKCQSNA